MALVILTISSALESDGFRGLGPSVTPDSLTPESIPEATLGAQRAVHRAPLLGARKALWVVATGLRKLSFMELIKKY